MLSLHFLKVAALMVSTITHAFVILGTLEGTATEILMTAALPPVNTVRLLGRKKKCTDLRKTKQRRHQVHF